MGFRDARKRAGRGLQETADYIGVSKQAVNAWERGVSEPSIRTCQRLAVFFGCTLEELIQPDGEDAEHE